MNEFQKSYCILFNACTDALRALEEHNYGQARQLLMGGQQRAEGAFLEAEGEFAPANALTE